MSVPLLLKVKILLLMIDFRITAEQSGLGINAGPSICDVKQLRNRLLEGHDPNIRPVWHHSEPTVIDLDFFIDSIVEFDEKVGKFSISGSFELKWIDQFLKWNKSDFCGIREIKASGKEIWTPELMLTNPYDKAKSLTGTDLHATVTDNGLVEWNPGQIFSVSCPVQELYYPVDYQRCSFYYFVHGSRITDTKLVTQHSKVQISHFQNHGEWKLVDTEVRVRMHGDAHLLTVNLLIKRRPLFIMITTLAPIILLSVLNLFVFCVPIETGEKITFSITIYLSYGVFLSGIIQSLPNQQTTATSYYTIYLMSLLGMSGLIVLLTTIQCRLYHYHRNKRVPRVLFCMLKIFKGRKHFDAITESKELKGETLTIENVFWSDFMSNLDRFLFIFFLVLLVAVTSGFFVMLWYPVKHNIGEH